MKWVVLRCVVSLISRNSLPLRCNRLWLCFFLLLNIYCWYNNSFFHKLQKNQCCGHFFDLHDQSGKWCWNKTPTAPAVAVQRLHNTGFKRKHSFVSPGIWQYALIRKNMVDSMIHANSPPPFVKALTDTGSEKYLEVKWPSMQSCGLTNARTDWWFVLIIRWLL